MTDPSPAYKNRRRAIRRQPRRATKVTCQRGTMGMAPNLAVGLLDVSENGVRLLLKEPVEPRQEVEVQLLGLFQRRPVRVVGAVVWCVPSAEGTYCVGIQFDRGIKYADFQQMV